MLAENLFSGFFESRVIGVSHRVIRRALCVQIFLQEIQNLFLFFDRQASDFVDDFKRTHALKLTEFCCPSKPVR